MIRPINTWCIHDLFCMPYLSESQTEDLIAYLNGVLPNDNSPLAARLKQSDIIKGLNKNSNIEDAKEDIESILEDKDVKLNDAQMDRMVHIALDYDHSDYNEYLSDEIDKLLEKES